MKNQDNYSGINGDTKGCLITSGGIALAALVMVVILVFLIVGMFKLLEKIM